MYQYNGGQKVLYLSSYYSWFLCKHRSAQAALPLHRLLSKQKHLPLRRKPYLAQAAAIRGAYDSPLKRNQLGRPQAQLNCIASADEMGLIKRIKASSITYGGEEIDGILLYDVWQT